MSFLFSGLVTIGVAWLAAWSGFVVFSRGKSAELKRSLFESLVNSLREYTRIVNALLLLSEVPSDQDNLLEIRRTASELSALEVDLELRLGAEGLPFTRIISSAHALRKSATEIAVKRLTDKRDAEKLMRDYMDEALVVIRDARSRLKSELTLRPREVFGRWMSHSD